MRDYSDVTLSGLKGTVSVSLGDLPDKHHDAIAKAVEAADKAAEELSLPENQEPVETKAKGAAKAPADKSQQSSEA